MGHLTKLDVSMLARMVNGSVIFNIDGIRRWGDTGMELSFAENGRLNMLFTEHDAVSNFIDKFHYKINQTGIELIK